MVETHVDWVIAIGMFLVYVVALFTYVKPVPITTDPKNPSECFSEGTDDLKNYIKIDKFPYPLWDKKNIFIKKGGKILKEFDLGGDISLTTGIILKFKEPDFESNAELNYDIYNGIPIEYDTSQ